MTPPGLQDELKKREPFESKEQEAILNILRTSDLFHNRLGRLLREYSLTGSQYNVLRILRGEGKPLPSLEIASRLIQVVPAITGLIDRLEKQELVSRVRCEKDRRVVYVAITPKALDVLAQIDQPLMAMHQRLIGHLDQEELQQLIHLLEKSRNGVTNEDS
ncbi:MarR family winged helix-turn-helix transcriptional regulator [Blastopirellula marina]|uniref:MarR family transcriptional regulator n=1 Tax=Blastopirellula marina TaxID=124 RepID=A0A2S8FP81_9BACT|nr:MarR family transcriptional regulator [Blastopirellula marina]PQO33810.1 MarR family transcriptional regulator [Blastopirellula marina]PTL43597.1 MarR family transcriptional regulator [Blastopirellula marina]